MRTAWIVATVGGACLIAMSGKASAPFMVWNASPSVPIGLYVIERRQPQRGDLALVRLAPKHAELAHRRGYFATTAFLLKPVVAIQGDRICRLGTLVLARQRIVALARITDAEGRPLPTWTGCRVLAPREVFVLARVMHSFDDRYFGPTTGDHVVGRAKSIWAVVAVPLP